MAEKVVVSTVLAPYLSLRALADYAGLSVRTLRTHIADTEHPLPCYRIGGKLLVKQDEYDDWAKGHRQTGPVDVMAIADDIMNNRKGRSSA